MHDLNPLARTRPVSVIVIIRSAPDSSISAKAAWKVARFPGRPFSNLAFRWIVSKIFAISHVRAVRAAGRDTQRPTHGVTMSTVHPGGPLLPPVLSPCPALG